TAMTAEVMMPRIQDKYRAFVYTIMGSCLMVILFNMFRPYPLFFFVAVFAATASLYLMALHRVRMMLPLVPIMLSLAAYSLLYPTLNANLKMLLENLFTTFVAMLVIISALLLFPLSYYYRLWLRAFRLACQALLANLLLIYQKQHVTVSLFEEDIKYMLDFSNMLPRKLPVYSILKINLLIHQLKNQSEVKESVLMHLDDKSLASLIQNVKLLIQAIEKETPCDLIFMQDAIFTKLIQTWNHVCRRQ
ncbi:MAG: hypothetical protein QNK11_03675, partial [Legionella sp.]|nr:hypothetical protein [Legionella sp.]